VAALSARLYWGVRKVSLLVAALLVALAVLLTLTRLLLPYAAPLRTHVTAYLQQHYGIATRIGGLDARWQSLGPVLVVKQVDLLNLHDTRQAMMIGQARLGIDFWQSLRKRKLVLSELALADLQLTVNLDGEGHAPADALAQLANLFLNHIDRFSVENGAVYLRLASRSYQSLYIRDLSWHNRGELHQGTGELSLVDDGNAARFVLRLTGPGEQPARLKGQFYVDARQLELAGALAKALPQEVQLKQARLNGQLWLGFDGGGLQYAVTELEDNRLEWLDGEQTHRLALDHARLQLQPTPQGWQLTAPQLALATDGRGWGAPALQLDSRGRRVLLSLDGLELAHLTPVLSLLPATRALGQELLAGQLQGRGQLSLRWDDWLRPQQFTLSGKLADILLQPTGRLPGTPPLQASFRLKRQQGVVLLSGAAGSLDYRGQFTEAWPMRQLWLDLNWQQSGQGWRLFSRQTLLDTEDVSFDGAWQLALPVAAPMQLSLYGEARVHDAAATRRYLPVQRLSARLVDYLGTAIQGGHAEQAKVLWHGPLPGFPYRQQQGIFQALVPLQGGQYQFRPGWQPMQQLDAQLRFVNDTLSIQADGARLGEVPVASVTAEFGHLNRQTVLAVRAGFSGQAKDARDYLAATPLRQALATPLTELDLQGPVAGELRLTIPFNGDPVGAQGKVVLTDASVSPQGLSLPLKQVHGEVRFDDRRVWAEQLSARLHQQPLRLSFNAQPTEKGYQADIWAQGQLHSEALLQSYRLQPWLPLSGMMPTSAHAQLLFPEPGSYRYTVDVDADLGQTRLALPAPFARQPGLPGRLSLAVRGQEDQLTLTAVLPDVASGQMRWHHASGGWQPAGVRLHLGRPRPLLRLPDSGLRLSGDLQRLSLLPWLRWLDTLPGTGGSPSRLSLADLDLQVERLDVAGMAFHHVHLVRLSGEPQARYQLTAEGLNALLSLPAAGGNPIGVAIESLDLPLPESTDTPVPAASPTRLLASMPWLELYCRQCRLDGRPLGEISFELKPEPDGVALNRLRIDMGHTRLEGGGLWREQAGMSHTRIHGKVVSDSAEQLLRDLRFGSPLKGAPGQVTFDLHWQGTPYQFNVSTLNGEAQGALQSGVLTEVSDKGARILSLFSVDSLVRKLKLDFRDVFDKGMYFDSLSTSVQLRGGVMHTDNYYMKGAAGDLRASGFTDLNRRWVDYDLVFYPNVTSSLPVVAAFAVTPVAGLYVYALSKVLSPVVEVVTKLQFNVKGPLEDPQVVEVRRTRGEVPIPRGKRPDRD